MHYRKQKKKGKLNNKTIDVPSVTKSDKKGGLTRMPEVERTSRALAAMLLVWLIIEGVSAIVGFVSDSREVLTWKVARGLTIVVLAATLVGFVYLRRKERAVKELAQSSDSNEKGITSLRVLIAGISVLILLWIPPGMKAIGFWPKDPKEISYLEGIVYSPEKQGASGANITIETMDGKPLRQTQATNVGTFQAYELSIPPGTVVRVKAILGKLTNGSGDPKVTQGGEEDAKEAVEINLK